MLEALVLVVIESNDDKEKTACNEFSIQKKQQAMCMGAQEKGVLSVQMEILGNHFICLRWLLFP